MAWADIEARIEENEEGETVPAPTRRAMLSLLRERSRLVPPPDGPPTKKMAYLEGPDGDSVAWEMSGRGLGLRLEAAAGPVLAFAEPGAKRVGPDGAGRHSDLDRPRAFGSEPRSTPRIAPLDDARRVPAALDLIKDRPMDPITLDRWIAAFRRRFADFATFDEPHAGFEQHERTGGASNGLAMDLMQRKRGEATTPEALRALARRVIDQSHLSRHDKSRFAALARDHGEEVGDVLAGLLGPEGEPTEAALAAAVGRLAPLVPRPGSGNPDTELVRTALQSLLMLAHPREWLDLNQRRRARVIAELYHEDAPKPADVAATAAWDRRIARDLLDALTAKGLAPRNTIDLHGFLWSAMRELDPQGSPPDEEAVSMPATALNTILYGPPGTGKTHATVARAVAICDGRDPDKVAEDPAAAHARYDELVALRRIEFVTFHQSYGYEEFVEGLRPDPGGDEEDSAPVGLRLRAVDGALKRIAERARTRPASRSADSDIETRTVFKVSLGRSNDPEDDAIRDDCLREGCILVGYGGTVDWSNPKPSSYESVAARWRAKVGDPNLHGHDSNIVSLFLLCVAMTEGDVVLASRGNRKVQAVGVVAGPYEFRQREDGYHHRRPVRWTWKDETGEGIDVADLYGRSFMMRTIYRLDASQRVCGKSGHLGARRLSMSERAAMVMNSSEVWTRNS